MNQSVFLNIGLAVIVLALIIYRQLRERPVKEKNPFLVMIILGIIGLYEIGSYISGQSIKGEAFIVLALSLVLAAVFGVLRGMTVHLWRDKGVLVQKGNLLTLVLWIVGLGLHIGSDSWLGAIDTHAAQLGSVSVLLYMAITLASQRFFVLQRAEMALEKEEFIRTRQEKKIRD